MYAILSREERRTQCRLPHTADYSVSSTAAGGVRVSAKCAGTALSALDPPMSTSPVGSLQRDIGTLFNSPFLSDVVLELPGQSFFTHRFILAARSPHFRALFAERAAHSQEGDIEFDDHGRERIILPATLSPVVLQAVLKYMYTDCVTVDGSDVSTMTSLMEAAAAFELQDLRLQCESKVLLDLLNVAEMRDFASRNCLPQLENRCVLLMQMKNSTFGSSSGPGGGERGSSSNYSFKGGNRQSSSSLGLDLEMTLWDDWIGGPEGAGSAMDADLGMVPRSSAEFSSVGGLSLGGPTNFLHPGNGPEFPDLQSSSHQGRLSQGSRNSRNLTKDDPASARVMVRRLSSISQVSNWAVVFQHLSASMPFSFSRPLFVKLCLVFW